MELGLTDRLKRNEQLARTARPAAPEKTEETPRTKRQKARADQLELSRRALDLLEQQRRQTEEIRRRNQQKRNGEDGGLFAALETEQKQLEGLDKELKTMEKCHKIAARVMAGDRVPPEDLRYLMEHDVEGYKLAMAMRRPKKDPKEWKSVLDDEDRNGGASENKEVSAAAAPEVEADSGGE